MSFKNAIESLENAHAEAEAAGDEATTHLSAGLIELARTLRTELADIKNKIAAVESKVRSLR